MKKINKNYLIIILPLIICASLFLMRGKSSDNATILDEVRLKDVKEENSMFAIMVQDGDNYIHYEQETWPTDGYAFNKDKSGCLDNDGKKISDIELSYADGKVTVETDATSYCYIYFDKKEPAGDVLKDKVGQGGLIKTNDNTDLDYRYTGACNVTNGSNTNGCDNKVDNFICFGTTDKSACKNPDSNYLYRIIGITLDNKIKIIKNTSIGGNKWHFNVEQNAVWDSGSGKIGSELFQKLNGDTFLNSVTYVPNGWADKIDGTKWRIGSSNGVSSEGIGKTETGSQVWTWEKSETAGTASKVGLMYLSDYYYSLNGLGDKNCYYGGLYTCVTSWMHISNNGDKSTQSSPEWTISRNGCGYGTRYSVWVVRNNGYSYPDYIYTSFAVRPVFYLESSVTISGGEGTLSSPYIIN